MPDKREEVLLAVLLFQTGDWTFEKQMEWQRITHEILGRPQSSLDRRWSDVTGWECTSRVLCDCIRKVLNLPGEQTL